MQQLTADQFKKEVESNPSWAAQITEPTEITEFCDMTEKAITYLSPYLHFTGLNPSGYSAYFGACKYLKVASGNYLGAVGFSDSGVEEIKDLICGKNKLGLSSAYRNCLGLKIATGTYTGYVKFSDSGVEKTKELICGIDNQGRSATFSNCKALEIATGTFPGFVSYKGSGIKTIDKLNITNGATSQQHLGKKVNITDCENLKFIPTHWDSKEILADRRLIIELAVRKQAASLELEI